MQSLSRISLLLLSFWFVNLARGQLINFSVNKEPLEKVLLLIEQQSGYNFIYSSEVIAKSKLVTLTVSKERFDRVLAKCFYDQPLDYKLDHKHVVVKLKDNLPPSAPAARILKGTVTNDQGQPMAGLTVSLRNGLLVRVTDANGDFFFEDAPVNSILIITGAEIEEQEIATGSQTFIGVVVKARIGTLDETMVIAYGKAMRRNSIGTVTSIKADEIFRQPVSNPLSILSGRVTGLQVTQSSGVPGSNITVRVRGRNSIANGNDPLYIVDGVPFPGTTLNGLLGGASGTFSSPLDNLNPEDIESIEVLKDAAATAIYGSRGANGVILITTKKGKAGKTVFSLRMYTGAGGVARKLDLLTTGQYLQMRREAYANDGTVPTLTNAPDLLLWDTTRYTDWQKKLTRGTMRIMDVNPTLSGGNESTQFLASAGYHKETTVFPGSFYAEKISGSLVVNHHSSDKKFSINLSGSFMLNNNIMPQQDLMSYVSLAPNAPALYTPEGKLNWEQSTWINPMSETLKSFRNNTDNFIFNVNASYRLTRHFTIKLSSGYNTIQLKEHSITPLKAQNPSQVMNAIASFGQRSIKTIIHEPQLTWSRSKHVHDLEILAGASLQESIQESLYQVGTGFTSDELLHSLKSAATVITGGDEYIRYRYAAIFGRANYSYTKKYHASVSIRRDGSSRYGPANRFSNFGSVGLAWVFSKEKVLQKSKVLDFGKLKISAGITGNDQIGDYRYLDLYSAYSYSYQGAAVFYPTQLFNPDFGWERVTKLEAGLETIFWGGRLSCNINYYHNNTTNQLVNYALPTLSGFSGITRNIPATIRNTGVEIELSSDILRRSSMVWASSLTITFPRNRLLAFDGIASSSYANTYVIGKPLSITKRLNYLGIDPATGNYLFADVNGDGRLSVAEDYKTIVDQSQQFFGGLLNKIDCGRLSFAILFQFASQPNASSFISRFGRPGGLGNQPEWVLDRWQKAGDNAKFQRFTVSNSITSAAFSSLRQSEFAYSNASFIRLKNLYIAFDLFHSKSGSRLLKQCKLTLQGQNLLTVTHFKNFDPETIGALPPIRVITGGIHLTF